jgi:uridine kinase
MIGDEITVFDEIIKIADEIIEKILPRIIECRGRFVISIAGESGSGKTVLAKAINQQFLAKNIKSVVLNQDDYFVLPPLSNDLKRRQDPDWLGPHNEVRLDVLDKNLLDAVRGKKEIVKPLVDYYANSIKEETISLENVKVLIAEGTYTSLLKNVNMRIFIEKSWQDTLENRLTRNRGNEAGDPFIENVLSIEHKIIAAHRQLADILVAKDNSVIELKKQATNEPQE